MRLSQALAGTLWVVKKLQCQLDGSERKCAPVALDLAHRMIPGRPHARAAEGIQPTYSWTQRSSSPGGETAASCPNLRAPNKKTPNPPKPRARVPPAITWQSSPAPASRRRRESNHQNGSPSNAMMLFIGSGMLCSVQRASKCHCFVQRGLGEREGASPSPSSTEGSLQARSRMHRGDTQGQRTPVAVMHGTYVSQDSGITELLLRGRA